MSDQAEKLRRLTKSSSAVSYDAPAALPMVVVAGARNGVGATTVAVNLAAAIADRGERVLVVDAAEGRNDLADMAGVGRNIEYCIGDILNGECEALDALIDGPMGMYVLANRGGVAPRTERESRRGSPTGGSNSREGQQRLLRSIDSLRGEIDLIVVDAGTGLTAWTRRFWLRAQCVVLVTTADDPSVMDSYSSIKISSADGIQPPLRLLVNREINVAAAEDAQRRVQNACRKFLSLSIEALPALPLDESEFGAGANRGPRVWETPNSAFSRATLWLGRAVSDALSKGVTQESVTVSGGLTPFEMFMQATDRSANY